MRRPPWLVAIALALAACAPAADEVPAPASPPFASASDAEDSLVPTSAAASEPDASGSPSPSPPSAAVSDAEAAWLEALVRFARTSSAEELAAVPLAPQVQLGLASDLVTERAAGELTDPGQWRLDAEAFRGYVGPFSALEVLARDGELVAAAGEHPHCASGPVPPPEAVGDLRRVSLQPRDISSCLQWFTVDLFLAPGGQVRAVTLDLWEP